MPATLKFLFGLLPLVLITLISPLKAEPIEKHIALVIGNAGYQVSPLTIPANDAGLIALKLSRPPVLTSSVRQIGRESSALYLIGMFAVDGMATCAS